MWQRVEKDCEQESPRAPSARLFGDERATPAVLEFPADTRVGREPSLAIFGIAEESELEEIVLWTEGEEGSGEESEENGPGPP